MEQETTYQVHFGKAYYYKEMSEVLEGNKQPDPMYHRIRNFNSYSKAQEFVDKMCERKGIEFCYLLES
jgi:hypothetical protein